MDSTASTRYLELLENKLEYLIRLKAAPDTDEKKITRLETEIDTLYNFYQQSEELTELQDEDSIQHYYYISRSSIFFTLLRHTLLKKILDLRLNTWYAIYTKKSRDEICLELDRETNNFLNFLNNLPTLYEGASRKN